MVSIAQTIRRASASIEDFRGDYDQLAAVMRSSWGQSPTPPYLYTADFLADCFRYPGAQFSLAPAIYHGSELVAFAVGYPRRVMVAGSERRILIATFLTVASAQKASGYGILVWADLMRRAAQAGFDGVVNYCAEGGAMDRMINATCGLLELPLLRVASFSYLTAVLPSGPSNRGGEPRDGPSAQHLLHAASALRGPVGVSRLWTDAEAAWQLTRLGAVAASRGPDTDPAVLTGYVISVADATETKCLVVDDVLWGGAAAHERPALVRDLVAHGACAGARAAILPVLGYADLQPFQASGFQPSPHTIHAYLTIWSEPPLDQPPERYYLDVI
jgi:hypothetical protein